MGKISKKVLSEIKKYSPNQLIIASELYRDRFSSDMSETAFAKLISRLCLSGKIERISKGIYCIPEDTSYGKILPSESEIVKLYTKNENGVVIGYEMYNYFGITTQIAKLFEVYSSSIDEKEKNIGNVKIKKYNLHYNQKTKSMIYILELLYNYKHIQDLNTNIFVKEIERLLNGYDEKVFEVVQKEIKYPKWVIAFLYEALEYYHISNKLNRYLSSFSTYSIPKMRDLYESARQEREVFNFN